MHRSGLKLLAAALVTLTISTAGSLAQASGPQFKPSALPPPEIEATPTPPSFYDIFKTDDVSPLGTPASQIKTGALMDQAATFLNATDGHPDNTNEAIFWLKRAIRFAPDESGKRRPWAVTNLGHLLYNKGDVTNHAAGRYLLEIAGAWDNPDALCDLGQLAELGDDVAKPDPKQAVAWFQRAKQAGCAQAEPALTRLQR